MLVIGSYSIVRTRLGGSVLKFPDKSLRLLVCGSVKGMVTVAESFFAAPAGCWPYTLPSPQNAEIKRMTKHLGVKNLVKFQLKFSNVIINFSAQILSIAQPSNRYYFYLTPGQAPFQQPDVQNPASPAPTALHL